MVENEPEFDFEQHNIWGMNTENLALAWSFFFKGYITVT